jgi:hypothetical protein
MAHRQRPDATTRRRARAFGLEISLDFDAPGLYPAKGPPAGPRTRVELVDESEIDANWHAAGSRRVLEETFGKRRLPDRTIDVHARAGYRLYARHFGVARVSRGGTRIACSPPGVAPWSWQRFLVGRILPWASVLRGLEPFHASAVDIDGRAVAIVGHSGAGKTSLALQLTARGAGFVTDDVLAVDEQDGVLRAHPGAGIVAVRPAERAVIPRSTWRRVGSVLGRSGKTYVQVPRVDDALPLGAIYFLAADSGPTVEAVGRPDPRLLLASTFVPGVQAPERLMRQLDVCSAIARRVPLYWLRPPPGVGSAELAAAVEAHARGGLPTTRARAA